jgi:hypothetical protein
LRNIGDIRLEKKQAIVDALPSGEECLAVARGTRWLAGTRSWTYPTLILTNGRLIVSKDKLIGKAAIDAEVSLRDIESSGSGPVASFGTWAIKFSTREGQDYAVIFAETDGAREFEEVLRQAVDRAQERAIAHLERLNPDNLS